MSTSTYNEVLSRVLRLSAEEQLELFKVLANIILPKVEVRTHHSILELEGLGKELWRKIDVEKYIEEERNSWDG